MPEVLWDRADADSELCLSPGFVADPLPGWPDAAGEHRIAGRAADCDELLSLDSTMPETTDGNGRGSSVFALPAYPWRADNLAGISLSGPVGSATPDSDTDLPITGQTDPVNG